MKKLKLSGCLLVVLWFHTVGQDHSKELLKVMEKAGIPGLSFAYVKDGKTAEHYSLGITSNDTEVPANDSTIFSAASLSKTIFSYAVFGLMQEKRLDPDKPLYTYYIYKDVAGDPRSKLVTARMILSHSSGLPNWRNGDSLQFKFNPGEKFSYSGEGMVWLSRVIEAITGEDIEKYISEKIFQPLGMHHSSYIWQKNFGDNYAYPHTDIGKSAGMNFYKEPNVAYSLQTTATDYAKFLEKILQDKKFMTALRKDPTVKVDEHLSWGDGLGHQENADGSAFFQWGDNGTFKAFVMGYPDKKAALVYFANSYNGLYIAKDILDLYFGGDQPSLTWLETDSADAPELLIFQKALHHTVAESIAPFYKAGKNIVDTNLLSAIKLFYIGRRFNQLRYFKKAIDFFLEGLKVDPSNDRLYAGLGEAYLRMGYKAKALSNYMEAVKRSPEDSIYQRMVDRLKGNPSTRKENEKMIEFRLPDYMNAHYVGLAGTFNNWNDLAEPMHWENGAWVTSIPLSKGQYRYKLVVDGVWLTDTRNPQFEKGSFDSDITVE